MSMLIIDAGNARLKWAAMQSGVIRSIGRADYGLDGSDALREVCAAVDSSIRQVVVGNVAGSEFGARLGHELRSIAGVEVWFARSAPETIGIRCGYERPHELGVDRWAAIVAAVERVRSRAPGRPVCIVDAGTALTIDIVDHESRHLGGLILPGLQLQRSALYAAAADIRKPLASNAQKPQSPQIFATSTDSALIVSGPFAAAAAVDRCVEYLSRSVADPQLVMTGGDAAEIDQWLATRGDICPNLVFEGLAILYEQRSSD